MNVGEREHDLAVEAIGDLAEQRGAHGIAILQVVPREPAPRVLVIEQIDETLGPSPFRQPRWSVCRARRREVGAHEVDEGFERSAYRPLGDARYRALEAEIACNVLERWCERASPSPRVDLHLAVPISQTSRTFRSSNV